MYVSANMYELISIVSNPADQQSAAGVEGPLVDWFL